MSAMRKYLAISALFFIIITVIVICFLNCWIALLELIFVHSFFEKERRTSPSFFVRFYTSYIYHHHWIHYNDSIFYYHIRSRRTMYDDQIIFGYFANKKHYFHYFRYRKTVALSRNNNFNLCTHTHTKVCLFVFYISMVEH